MVTGPVWEVSLWRSPDLSWEADFWGYKRACPDAVLRYSELLWSDCRFISAEDQGAQGVYGFKVCDAATGEVWVAERFAEPFVFEGEDDELIVRPRLIYRRP